MDISVYAEWTGYMAWMACGLTGLIVLLGLLIEWGVRAAGVQKDILEAGARLYRERADARSNSAK